MIYTYPNGDFISSSRSKIDNNSITQKLKNQSNNSSGNNSTNSTINKSTGKAIQNDIENADVSKYPFDFFSKKRIISENKNQTITSIPMSNSNNSNISNCSINDESSQLEMMVNEENIAYANKVRSKKRVSI